MADFTRMSLDEIDRFLAPHAQELEIDYVAGQLPGSVAAGIASIECRPLAFAVILIMQKPEGVAAHLLALYVAAEARGRRIGASLVRDLLHKHAHRYAMTLSCHGARRRRFFGRLGFRIESRDGEWRRMTSEAPASRTLHLPTR